MSYSYDRRASDDMTVRLPNVNGLWHEAKISFLPARGIMRIMLHTRKQIPFGFSHYISYDRPPQDIPAVARELTKGRMPRDFKHLEGAKFDSEYAL